METALIFSQKQRTAKGPGRLEERNEIPCVRCSERSIICWKQNTRWGGSCYPCAVNKQPCSLASKRASRSEKPESAKAGPSGTAENTSAGPYKVTNEQDRALLRDNVNAMIRIAEELVRIRDVLETNGQAQMMSQGEMDRNFREQNAILEKVMVSIGVIAVTEKYSWREKGNGSEDCIVVDVEEKLTFRKLPDSEEVEVQEVEKGVDKSSEIVENGKSGNESETLKEI